MKAPSLRPWELLLASVLLLIVLAVVLFRLTPPSPSPLDALPDRFSAARAAAVLDEILGDGAPHPVGSEANAKVRERIVTKLRELGYSPDTQSEFVCGRYGVCAPVVNVIARHEGESRKAGEAVALVAHYDSVPAGPGAADDGSGVATLLEIARILKLGPPLGSPVVLLFTDGEEAGMLGAQAFVERHPLSRDIRAVVNMEARGTRGPSLLFETRGDEAWLVDLVARHVPRPVTSSVFSAVYEKMPNDSDLSVFSRAGISGVNFAFLGGVAHYHTPTDDLAHLSLASLQHHGDHALGMIRALADAEPSQLVPSKAIYFDLLSFGVIRYSPKLALPLAIVALSAMAALLLAGIRRRHGTAGEVTRGLAVQLLAPAIAAVTSLGLIHLLGLLGVTRPWVAYPAPLLLTFISAGILAVTLSAFFTRDDSPLGTFAGTWLGWGVLGIAVAFLLPAASYLFLLPTLGAALAGGFLLANLPHRLGFAALLFPALLSGLVLFPILAILYDAVGLPALPVLATFSALALGTLLPFASGLAHRHARIVTIVPALAAGLGVLLTVTLPLSSEEAPERLSLTFHQDADTGLSHGLAEAESRVLPEPMRQVMSFGARMTAALPWSHAMTYAAPIAAPKLPAPDIHALQRGASAGLRHVKVRVQAGDDSPTVLFAFPSDSPIRRLTIEGEPAFHRLERGSRLVTVRGVPAGGIEVEATIEGGHPVAMTVVKSTSGLPPEARALASSRPRSAVPSQEGDVTLVSRRFEL